MPESTPTDVLASYNNIGDFSIMFNGKTYHWELPNEGVAKSFFYQVENMQKKGTDPWVIFGKVTKELKKDHGPPREGAEEAELADMQKYVDVYIEQEELTDEED